MNYFIIFIIVVSYAPTYHGTTLSEESLQKLFGLDDCIEGYLESNENAEGSYSYLLHAKIPSSKNDIEESIKPLENSRENNMNEKFQETPVAYINRLCFYNKIKSSYEVINEDGPAHKKVFTVSLLLGDETYNGEGPSIKKAKQAAASAAIKHTKYIHPVVKEKNTHKNISISNIESELDPVSLVHQITKKLDISVTFELADEIGPPHERTFVMRCIAGNVVRTGKGSTKKMAKAAAASKVLEELRKDIKSKENIYTQTYSNSWSKKSKNTRRRRKKNKIKKLIRNIKNKSTWFDGFPNMWRPTMKWEDTQLKTTPYHTDSKTKDSFEDDLSKQDNQDEILLHDIHTKPSEKYTYQAPKTTNQGIFEDSESSCVSNKCDEDYKSKSENQDAKFNGDEKFNVELNKGNYLVFDPNTITKHSELNFGPQKSDAASLPTFSSYSMVESKNAKEVLVNIFHRLHYDIKFYEFYKMNNSVIISIAQLPLDPPLICYGEGSSVFEAQNQVSLKSLKFLKSYTQKI